MKTKDSISKKRQKLSQEIEYWWKREQSVRTNIQWKPEETAAQAAFCRQEVAKRQEELQKLQTRSVRQVLAGWK